MVCTSVTDQPPRSVPAAPEYVRGPCRVAAARNVMCVCVCPQPASLTFCSPQGFRIQLPCPAPPSSIFSPPQASSSGVASRSHTHLFLHPCDGLTPPSLVPPLCVSTPPSRLSLSLSLSLSLLSFPRQPYSSLSIFLPSSPLPFPLSHLPTSPFAAGWLATARLGSGGAANWTT